MEKLNIKNVRALNVIGPRDETDNLMTLEIATLFNRLHEVRIEYDPAVWGPGSRSTDSAVIKTLISYEIARYEAKIKARGIAPVIEV
jgi:hypothetical protein